MISAQDQAKLLDIIKDAEDAVMGIYASSGSLNVTLKADNSPLTQADLVSHQIIISALGRLFPKIPIVSEEGSEDENSRTVLSKSFWLVDPLDGTNEFIARNGEFTVCVALIEDNIPVFGIVSAPALGVTYYGGPSIGSYKKQNGKEPKPIHVSKKSSGVIMISRSRQEKATLDYISKNFANASVKSAGSFLKVTQIAEGLADAYPRFGSTMRLWDLAPGQAILEGAGGSVARPDGTPIDYHAQSLMVGDFVAQA